MTKLGNEKAHKENPQNEFQRESGRGSGKEVSGPEFFMLVSCFPSKIQRIKNFKRGGSQGLGRGEGSKVQIGDHFFMFMCFLGT